MCDTLVRRLPDRVLFAKNSDRDANEAQILDWQPAREHPSDSRLACTWIEIPQARRTHAVVLSRPLWMWGAEMGANEHGVAIGNEAVFTRARLPESGLTGMDLVRLALERAATAEAAVETIAALLAAHGQGGGCGFERPRDRYSSSFLIADPGGAWVLETSGREWVAERVAAGARTISNRLTLREFAAGRERSLHARVARADRRRHRTSGLCTAATTPRELAGVLRDHGVGRSWPDYRFWTGTLGVPCMHGGGVFAAVTTASWISELRRDGEHRHWATATSSPCLSLFKPVAIGTPVPAAGESFWWRHESLHRRLLADPNGLAAGPVAERDALEADWWTHPPNSLEAFAEHERRIRRWSEEAAGMGHRRDQRPAHARRWWRRRELDAMVGAQRREAEGRRL